MRFNRKQPRSYLALILFFTNLCYGAYPTFIPPQGWEIVSPKVPTVKIVFLAKGPKSFRPSINLAIEEDVDISLTEYVKAVKEIHREDRMTNCRDLGPFLKGELLELTQKSTLGEIKKLQYLVVQDNKAYILTAATLKEDFLSLQKEILQSFRSLQISKSLFTQIHDVEKQKELAQFFDNISNEGDWKIFQSKVAEHKNLGPYWAFLLLQEGYAKVYASDLR